jgi:hypothetical protein
VGRPPLSLLRSERGVSNGVDAERRQETMGKATMKRMFALCLGVLALPATAATYTFTGPAYTAHNDHTACPAGTCADYTLSMNVTGSITTATPLPPSSVILDIGPLVTSYSFNDGINTIASSDSNARIAKGFVVTDAAGTITGTDLRLQQWTTGTPGAHAVGDRLNMITIISPTLGARNNIVCATMAAGDVCIGFNVFAAEGASWADGVIPIGWIPWTASGVYFAPASVPALAPWSLVVLALLLLWLGVWFDDVRSRRKAKGPGASRGRVREAGW